MTEEQKKRLKELVAKKKAKTLTSDEAKELAELNKLCGFKHKDKKQGKQSKGFVPGNDFSWWAKEPELLRDSATFKSNYIAGDAIAGNDCPFVIPGILRVVLDSVYGNDKVATDPINVWARDTYLKMFQKYRPASGYSASDMGIAILAGNEVVKLFAKYERIYGIINRYSKLNINMPRGEAFALGLSSTEIDYLQGHLSDFRYDLNFLAKKAQRLCIPKEMSIIADAISLFGYEYVDHESKRSQIIIFDNDTFGIYDDTVLTSGGSIQFVEFDSANPLFDFSADNMCAALTTALDALLTSDSIQRIYADLVVWFGEGAMLQFVPVPEDYIVVPNYSESMLHKLHNLETFDAQTIQHVSWASNDLSPADQGIVGNGNYWVYQCNDIIITKGGYKDPAGTASFVSYDGGQILASNAGVPVSVVTCHILDTYRNDVNEETIVEGVLLKHHHKTYSSSGSYVSVTQSAAFYVPRYMVLFSMNGNSVATNSMVNVANQGSTAAAVRAGNLSVIDWAPLSYNLGSDSETVDEIFGDLDNVVPLYYNDMRRLHRTIELSGLKIDATVTNK